MELFVKNIKTKKGIVQGCQLKWTNSWLFVIDAPKGSIVCGSFDIEALDNFGLSAAKIVPELGNPAYNIDEFVKRKITHVNKLAKKMGVKPGMSVNKAIELMY